ncbi:MAG: hypothetical protein WBK04_02515 [Bacillota bacterium]|jgi:peptidoglycan hydrolase CwlO-like protein
MWNRTRQFGTWLLGLLVAAGAVLLGINRYQTGRMIRGAQKAKSEAEKRAAADLATTNERLKHIREKQDEIDARIKERDKRLADLEKRFPKGPLVLIIFVISMVLLGSICHAEDPQAGQLPGSYAELAKLYFQALDRIAELEAGIQEAIDLAKGYRSDWEAQKELTKEATSLVEMLKGTIAQLQDVINKQHEVIMKLTSKRGFGVIGGVMLQPEANGAFRPGAMLAVQIPLW